MAIRVIPDGGSFIALDQYGSARGKPRYPGDMTTADRARVAPLIRPAKWGGNQRTVTLREVSDRRKLLLGAGCPVEFNFRERTHAVGVVLAAAVFSLGAGTLPAAGQINPFCGKRRGPSLSEHVERRALPPTAASDRGAGTSACHQPCRDMAPHRTGSVEAERLTG